MSAAPTPGYSPPSFLVSALKAGVPFAIAMTAFFTYQRGLHAGLTSGPIAGVLFGLVMTFFLRQQSTKLVVRSEVLDGERIVRQGPANHWRNGEARGGWLVLTERALVFRAHDVNADRGGARVELASVRAVSPCRTLGVVPNGMKVELRDGAVETFVVNDRSEWIARVQQTSGPT